MAIDPDIKPYIIPYYDKIQDKTNNVCSLCHIRPWTENYGQCEELVIIQEKHYCFQCAFWEVWARREPNPNYVVVNGTHYVIKEETSSSYFRGFGGGKFEIEFFDGRKVISTNLWYQGVIPEFFRDRMPNNARFTKEF